MLSHVLALETLHEHRPRSSVREVVRALVFDPRSDADRIWMSTHLFRQHQSSIH